MILGTFLEMKLGAKIILLMTLHPLILMDVGALQIFIKPYPPCCILGNFFGFMSL